MRADGSEYGSQGSRVQFEYEAASVISSVSPSKGLVSGGTLVTVHGIELATDKDGAVMCSFGGVKVDATEANSTVVICKAPRYLDAGVVAFGVMMGGGMNVADGTLQYEYYSTSTRSTV